MCGRYQLEADPRELAEALGLEDLPELPARYNIAPTQEVPVVRMRRSAPDGPEVRRLVTMRWGLVPHFAKDAREGVRAINARAETVDSRPAFRDAFARRRCLVPATGFYEWRRMGRVKQPYLIRRPDRKPFAFAGLWARWKGGEQPLDTFTIVTTAANARVADVHDRMPVVLAPEDYARWLAPESDPGRLKALLGPAPDDALELVPVSTRVNDVAADDPECARPVTPDEVRGQRSLF